MLEVAHLSHRYRRNRTLAIDDVDFAADVGALGILGPNGAGKTTLQRILATTLRPTAGEVRLAGKSLRGDLAGYRRSIGYLPQRLGYLPHFTVSEFVEYAAWLKGLSPRAVRDACAHALEVCDVSQQAQTKMRELSGGMLRRVGIAQAVVNDPDVLLLDEPTVGLDPEQRSHVRSVLRKLADHMTILLSTHLTEDVSAVCAEVLVIDRGRLCYRGSPPDLALLDDSSRSELDTPLERGYAAVLQRNRMQLEVGR